LRIAPHGRPHEFLPVKLEKYHVIGVAEVRRALTTASNAVLRSVGEVLRFLESRLSRLLFRVPREFLFQIGAGLAEAANARPPFVPVERSLRSFVELFAPLRDKVTSSAQPLSVPVSPAYQS